MKQRYKPLAEKAFRNATTLPELLDVANGLVPLVAHHLYLKKGGKPD
jgi:hypothetical protein